MSQSFVNLDATTFKKGDVLTRSGKTATIIEPTIHRTSRKFIGYEVDLLTDGKGFTPQRVTLFTADIRENWTLEPAQASIPIGRFFEINDGGEAVPETNSDSSVDVKAQIEAFLNHIGIVSFFDVKRTAPGEPGEWMFTTNLMTPGAVERRLSESGCPSFTVEDNEYEGQRAWSAKAWFVPPSEFALVVEPVGEQHAAPSVVAPADDSPAATIIADLNTQIEQLRDRNAKLEARNLELNGALEFATSVSSEDVIERLKDSRDSAIDEANAAQDEVSRLQSEALQLTEQLAEARLAASPIQSAPAVNYTVAPMQEICVIRDITQHLFTEKINQGWQQIHMQFMPGEERDTLNVVFVKTMLAPGAPEPLRASVVKPVGNMVTILPIEPIPAARVSFNAETYLENMLADCNQAAEDVLKNAPVLNIRQPQLTGAAVKPEVRRG